MTIEVSPGRIHAILESLIGERKRLERGPEEASLVEANRMAIRYWQDQLERREQTGRSTSPHLRADSPDR